MIHSGKKKEGGVGGKRKIWFWLPALSTERQNRGFARTHEGFTSRFQHHGATIDGRDPESSPDHSQAPLVMGPAVVLAPGAEDAANWQECRWRPCRGTACGLFVRPHVIILPWMEDPGRTVEKEGATGGSPPHPAPPECGELVLCPALEASSRDGVRGWVKKSSHCPWQRQPRAVRTWKPSKPHLLAREGPNTGPTWKVGHLQHHKSPGTSTDSPPYKLWSAALYSDRNYFQWQNDGAQSNSLSPPGNEGHPQKYGTGEGQKPTTARFQGVLGILGSKKRHILAVIEVHGCRLFRQFWKSHAAFRLLDVVENAPLIRAEFVLIWVTGSTIKSERGRKRVIWS